MNSSNRMRQLERQLEARIIEIEGLQRRLKAEEERYHHIRGEVDYFSYLLCAAVLTVEEDRERFVELMTLLDIAPYAKPQHQEYEVLKGHIRNEKDGQGIVTKRQLEPGQVVRLPYDSMTTGALVDDYIVEVKKK